MTAIAPKLITGYIYDGLDQKPVTGFPTHVHRAGDPKSATSLAIVNLLTEDGVQHFRVFVPASELVGVAVRSLHTWSEAGLWNLAEKNWRGYGALALAELAKREAREIYGRQVAREAELLRSRRSADMLVGR